MLHRYTEGDQGGHSDLKLKAINPRFAKPWLCPSFHQLSVGHSPNCRCAKPALIVATMRLRQTTQRISHKRVDA